MTNMEYHTVTVEVEGDENLEHVVATARNSPGFYRLYIDDIDFVHWEDESQYYVEVFFANENDAMLFRLKI